METNSQLENNSLCKHCHGMDVANCIRCHGTGWEPIRNTKINVPDLNDLYRDKPKKLDTTTNPSDLDRPWELD